MIEIFDATLKDWVRCEAARVYLPGYEYIEVYATPFYTGEFRDDVWVLTEINSGWRFGNPASTVEEAVTQGVAYLNRIGMTRERFEEAVKRAVKSNLAERPKSKVRTRPQERTEAK